jgi:hypothetical protein
MSNRKHQSASLEASSIKGRISRRDCIRFMGAAKLGRIIAQKAATQLKRCLLELGGKAPLAVLDDANVDEAVMGPGLAPASITVRSACPSSAWWSMKQSRTSFFPNTRRAPRNSLI